MVTDSHAIRRSVLRDWKNDRKAQELTRLAYALGVGKIVIANREIDDENFHGEYFYARDSHETHQDLLKPWRLSPRQLATINRTLRSGRDVILVSYESCGDFAATLAHEIGHHINLRLRGLSPFEYKVPEFSRVTGNMCRVARFADYFFQSRDEYYAESWSRFLCGHKNRALFCYLNRPFGRLRVEHPEKARLIEQIGTRVLSGC